MRTRPRRWILALALLPLTTCDQLVAPHVGGAIAYVHMEYPTGYQTTFNILERPGPGAHLRVRQVSLAPMGVEVDRPSWSPDGRLLMLATVGASGSQLYTMSYPEGQLTQVTSSPLKKLCPSWSPDGTRAAVSRGVTLDDAELVIIDLATKIETPVFATHPGFTVICPQWSPDGTRIAFHAGAGTQGPSEIYVVGVDGTGLRNLTNTPDRFESYPAWSPDARRIAFWSDFNQIIIVDGSGASVPVTKGGCPSWSPGGEAITFMSEVSDTIGYPREVYAVDVRDHDRERLTFSDGGGLVWCPAWQP